MLTSANQSNQSNSVYNHTDSTLSHFKDTEVSEPGYLSSFSSSCRNWARYIFVPDEKPTWKDAITKTSAGFLGFVSLNPLLGSDWVTTGLIITGAREICYLAYTRMAYPKLPQELADKISVKNKYEKKIKEKDKELARAAKLVKLIALSGLSLNCLYNHDSLGNRAFFGNTYYMMTYHDFDFHKLGATESGFKCVQIAACIANLILNLMELKNLNKDSFLTSSPITEIVNAFVIASFFSQDSALDSKTAEIMNCYHIKGNFADCLPELKTANSHRQFLELKKTMYILGNKLYANMEGIGDKGLYTPYLKRGIMTFTKQVLLVNGISMLKSNTETYWNKNPLLEKNVIPLDIQIKSPTKPKSNKPFQILIIEADQSPAINDIAPLQPCAILPTKEDPTFFTIREKKKTRGTPNKSVISKQSKSAKASSSQSKIPSDLLKDDRKAALDRIKELRNEYPVKAVKIEKELKLVAAFLNGKIKPVDGNEFRLEWSMGGNNFGMKFEKPHGQDATNYKANKLDRVLSVLETAYLVGLDEELANKYIKEYNLYNLTRASKFIYFIFSNKTPD